MRDIIVELAFNGTYNPNYNLISHFIDLDDDIKEQLGDIKNIIGNKEEAKRIKELN